MGVGGWEYLLRFVLPGEAESVASVMSDLGNPNILCDPSSAILR